MSDLSAYFYSDDRHYAHHHYLDGNVLELLRKFPWPPGERRVFELGCGNGSFAKILDDRGYSVTAVDTSVDGIKFAKSSLSGVAFYNASAYDDLASAFGKFGVVVSLEVIEHIFEPRKYAKCVFDLVEEGGIAIISTPYHSYMKNLALALSGKMDAHFTALWDYGHIKFWSIKTLNTLLADTGFRDIEFRRAGRIPSLAKSMIAIARRPQIR